MANQIKYFLLYLCVLWIFIAKVTPLAQARTEVQEGHTREEYTEQQAAEFLNQGELDQILAPIALYPDTLLSHILVAATYPLEVVQAARWRARNETLDEEAALEAMESKGWDPSVKALVPFNALLQKFSEDLDWLQSLGDAFLLNEEQVLSSVQNLRQKAYAQGNLQDNDYLNIEQDEGQILIQTVEKEVVYVPYYDTRVVYGHWRWKAYPPPYWQRPNHYVWHSGFYWSPGFYIRPSFYFGGFHWLNRHLVADYHYRNTSNRNWIHHRGHSPHQTARVREYPRWNHDTAHRRGVRYPHSQNANRYVSSNKNYHGKKQHQIDKQRVLTVQHLKNKRQSQQVKQRLAATKGLDNPTSAHKGSPVKVRRGLNRLASNKDSPAKTDKQNGYNHQQRLINRRDGAGSGKRLKQTRDDKKEQQQSASVMAPQPPVANKSQRHGQQKTSHTNKKTVYRSEESGKHRSKSGVNRNQRPLKHSGPSLPVQREVRTINTVTSRHKQSRH